MMVFIDITAIAGGAAGGVIILVGVSGLIGFILAYVYCPCLARKKV